MKRLLSISVHFAMALTFLGCGSSRPPGPPLHKVVGTVQLNGAPLPEAVVAFIPQGGVTSGVGTSDDTGRFVLLSSSGKEGVAAGKYKVTVTKAVAKPAPEATTFEEMEKEHKAGKKRQPIKFENLVPTVYQTSETTTLEAEVKESGENTFTFPLKS